MVGLYEGVGRGLLVGGGGYFGNLPQANGGGCVV